MDNPKRKATYATPNGPWKGDQTECHDISPDWKGPGWYRFARNVGSKIPEHTAKGIHCGTHASGWLQDKHPTVIGETKSARPPIHFDTNVTLVKNILGREKEKSKKLRC